MQPLQGHTVGFIGLGLMGRAMSVNLHKAGARLVIFNRSRGVIEELAGQGMNPAHSPAEVARRAPIVIVMVSDTPAVEEVLFGPHGVGEGLREGSLVIDMGTTLATSTRDFARRIGSTGADYIDAPVSGGEIGAKAGTLTIMAGGDDQSIERARPLFEVLGSSLTHIGGVGTGQVAKAANQVIVGLTIGAVSEALSLATRAGADPRRVRDALLGGFAASRILEVHGLRMIEGRFEPGGKATTQRKDMAQALELGRSVGLELPATRLNMELYDRLIAAGHGELDHSALVKVIGPRE